MEDLGSYNTEPLVKSCLALDQPYIDAVWHQLKKHETRKKRRINHVGWLALSATDNVFPDICPWYKRRTGRDPQQLPRKSILVIAQIDGSKAIDQALADSVSADERMLGYWEPNSKNFAVPLKTVIPLETPIPVRNMPGLFPLPSEIQWTLDRIVRAYLEIHHATEKNSIDCR